jgi:hypothetical protein
MKAKFVCYDEKTGNSQTVEVSGETLDSCESLALKKTGMTRISRARIVEGDLNDVMKMKSVKISNLN